MPEDKFDIVFKERNKKLTDKTELYDDVIEVLEESEEIKKLIDIINDIKQSNRPILYSGT